MLDKLLKSWILWLSSEDYSRVSHCVCVCDLNALGENLNGSVLSFTSHPQSCLLERKDRLYTLIVNTHGPYQRMSERTFLTINLPYYNSTLYVCLQIPNAPYPIHQGDR